MSGSNKFLYAGLIFAQLLTLCAYVVVTAGAALLQRRANTSLAAYDGSDPVSEAAYKDVFQSSTYIIPYPGRPRYQFQYQWWIIEWEFFIFLWTLVLTAFPRFIRRARPVALTFLATALVLIFDNVNAVFFLLRDETACTVFQKYRIATAQAGLIMVGVANGLNIIFLGLWDDRAYELEKGLYPGAANYVATNQEVTKGAVPGAVAYPNHQVTVVSN